MPLSWTYFELDVFNIQCMCPKGAASLKSVCTLVSFQRSGPSWWSSRNVWTSRQTWGSSCCRTFRISSERSQRSRWNTPGTWRSWPNASWLRLGAPRTTNNTSKHLSMKPTWFRLVWTCFRDLDAVLTFWHRLPRSTNIPHCLSEAAIARPVGCARVYNWQTLVWLCGFTMSYVPSDHFIHNVNTFFKCPESYVINEWKGFFSGS